MGRLRFWLLDILLLLRRPGIYQLSVRNGCGGTYAEFMFHQIIHQPISEEQDIGLSCDVLGQSKEDSCCLCESRCVETNAILELDWKGIG